MIRRAFWLGAGAATGIIAYRRVSALSRRVSGKLPRGGAGSLARETRGWARETIRFTRDVREGMELYMARHSVPAGSTLRTDHEIRPKDGR